jgi:isopentenyl diphosphate isomerase/L-lactate dehydrogenase-like FMN-dependent dehydrogenase
VEDLLRRLTTELRIAMFCVGAASVAALRATPHIVDAGAPGPVRP